MTKSKMKTVQRSMFKVQGCKRQMHRLQKSFAGSNVEHRTLNIERSSSAFTSVELVVVIVCLAILAGTAVVSFRLNDEDKSTIAADQLIADIQYVQMRAMGIGNQQNILFYTGTSSYEIREGTTVVEQKKLADDVIVRNADFNGSNVLAFNTLGEPTFSSSANGTITLGKGTGPDKTITVLAITGKVQ